MATGHDKPPFDLLVSSLSPALLRQPVGVRLQESQRFSFVFDPKFRVVLRTELRCDLERFGSSLGLSTARVGELMSAADGDRGKQIDFLLLAWVESDGERATFEEALRAVYTADDTQAVEIIAKELGDSG